MPKKSAHDSVSRRNFLKRTGGLLAATPALAAGMPTSATGAPAARPVIPTPPGSARKIPIGVFDPVYDHLSLDEMLDKITAIGIEAVEMGTGGYPGTKHCPVADLLADPAKANAWKKKFEDRNILLATFSCHGNPVHPDPGRA